MLQGDRVKKFMGFYRVLVLKFYRVTEWMGRLLQSNGVYGFQGYTLKEFRTLRLQVFKRLSTENALNDSAMGRRL